MSQEATPNAASVRETRQHDLLYRMLHAAISSYRTTEALDIIAVMSKEDMVEYYDCSVLAMACNSTNVARWTGSPVPLKDWLGRYIAQERNVVLAAILAKGVESADIRPGHYPLYSLIETKNYAGLNLMFGYDVIKIEDVRATKYATARIPLASIWGEEEVALLRHHMNLELTLADHRACEFALLRAAVHMGQDAEAVDIVRLGTTAADVSTLALDAAAEAKLMLHIAEALRRAPAIGHLRTAIARLAGARGYVNRSDRIYDAIVDTGTRLRYAVHLLQGGDPDNYDAADLQALKDDEEENWPYS
jgi:hypothetical protein